MHRAFPLLPCCHGWLPAISLRASALVAGRTGGRSEAHFALPCSEYARLGREGRVARAPGWSTMAEPTRRAIIITRNGRTTVITGWRAWLLGFGGSLIAWFLLALVVFALVGVAITVGLALLLLIPAVAIVALIGMLVGREI